MNPDYWKTLAARDKYGTNPPNGGGGEGGNGTDKEAPKPNFADPAYWEHKAEIAQKAAQNAEKMRQREAVGPLSSTTRVQVSVGYKVRQGLHLWVRAWTWVCGSRYESGPDPGSRLLGLGVWFWV
jgi:hypothetical protein